MGDLNVWLQVFIMYLFFLSKRVPAVHDKNIFEFRNQFVIQTFFVEKGFKIAVKTGGVADNPKVVIVFQNIFDGAVRVGLVVVDLCRAFINKV